MTSVTSRFLELIRRNLKSDAVPRPPRQESNSNQEVPPENPRFHESAESASEPEEILIEDNDINTDDFEPKVKGSFFKNKKKNGFKDPKPKVEDIDPDKLVTVNTQAAGHVINIVNSSGTHWGNNYVYHLGSKKTNTDADPDDDVIQKNEQIALVMEAIEEHTDPNYSCAYVTTTTENGKQGFGLTFTCGRGTEIVVLCIRALKRFVVGRNAADIFADFAGFWRTITNDSQMRWIGPEKGVAHLAAAAILNSLWDLWARLENKPLWRLLVDMEPEELVSTIDFRYITDVVTKEEAIQMLKAKKAGKAERVKYLIDNGYPAYTTQVGWMGYSDELVKELCEKYLKLGFTNFKVKVGLNLADDLRRCSAVRKHIGDGNILMVDANQAWSVDEAIEWMKKLAHLKPLWIEEPTSPDDVLGHAAISMALKPYGIGVATGEMCANRVMFKQFLQSGGMQYCQIDSARIGGINEILSVYLMAGKLKVKVCPHAGGVGLCEMVNHLQFWDYASLSGVIDGRLIEYVDQQHEHFFDPCIVENARYLAPKNPGYSTRFFPEAVEKFSYPNGSEWQRMFKEGIFPKPDEAELVNA